MAPAEMDRAQKVGRKKKEKEGMRSFRRTLSYAELSFHSRSLCLFSLSYCWSGEHQWRRKREECF